MKKRLIGAVCALAMCGLLLCGCGKDAKTEKLGNNDPNHLTPTVLSLSNATAKAGKTVALKLAVEQSSDLWGFSWEVAYDSAVLIPVDVEMSHEYTKNFELDLNKTQNPLVLQGAGRDFQNYAMTGQAATLTFRVADNAAPGDTKVSVSCKDGNNIDVDANDIPFTPLDAVVTVE